MSRAILVFSLPQERNEFEITQKGMDWALAMSDLDTWLRNQLEHHDGPEEYEIVRDRIRIILGERGVDLDDIE